ncbi:MAG: transposase, partial [Candidatus Bathyarchaeia archaeon]
MGFVELSDDEWSLIGSFLPTRPGRGRRALVGDRAVLNGILYVLTTGCR